MAEKIRNTKKRTTSTSNLRVDPDSVAGRLLRTVDIQVPVSNTSSTNSVHHAAWNNAVTDARDDFKGDDMNGEASDQQQIRNPEPAFFNVQPQFSALSVPHDP